MAFPRKCARESRFEWVERKIGGSHPRGMRRGWARYWSLLAVLLPLCAAAAELEEGIEPEILALIRQSEIAQASGDFEQALPPLVRARALAEEQANPLAVATARAAIGNLYIAIAEPDDAVKELEATLSLLSDRPSTTSLRAAIHVNLGNALLKLADLQPTADAIETRRRALASFRQAIVLADSVLETELGARARASGFRISIDLAEQDLAEQELADQDVTESDLAQQQRDTRAFINQVGDLNTRATLLLHLARSLERLPTPTAQSESQISSTPDRRLTIHQLLVNVIDLSAEVGNDRTRGYALLHLAELYQSDARDGEAAVVAERSVRAAQRSDDAVLRWRSWILLGRIHRLRDQSEAAINAFAEGLEEIEAIRHRRQIAYGFSPSISHAEVKRAQTEFVDLVLLRASRRPKSEADAIQGDLALAQNSMERLKAGELRDYFDDECVDAALSRRVDVGKVAERTALIYPIALPDRLELLVSTSKGRSRISIPVTEGEIEKAARRLRATLEDRLTNRYLSPARQLYDWVIRPLLPALQAENVQTLIFVPGGWLRSIPMAALHDGERFLIEDFEVAVTPGLELTDPRPLSSENPLALFAGLSKAVEGFNALPEVERELEASSKFFPGKVLLDEGFVPEAMHRELSTLPYSIVHIASHAVFSSASEAFVLTHSGHISVSDLSDYVALFKNRTRPLELLMLSACETALGDERAALGLSGIAVKAGARSAVGSLWRVNDVSAREFTTGFYEALSQPGVSRAQAMQRAQIALLRTRGLSHPSHWAPFILIGNWL